MTLPESTLTKRQTKKSAWRAFDDNGHYRIRVEMRHDDSCGNGHNTFSITAAVDEWRGTCWDFAAGGACHDQIAKYFPEHAPLIKWHLCSTDGPMGYPGNPIYLAGDKDCWGTREGEAREHKTFVRFGDNPILHGAKRSFGGQKFIDWLKDCQGQGLDPETPFDFEVIRVDHDDRGRDGKPQFQPHYTFGGFGKRWHDCPFDTEQEAMNFLWALNHCDPVFVRVATAWGEGKAPEIEEARNSAIWPEATAEQLTDREALMARLPVLMAEFKAAVESVGFVY